LRAAADGREEGDLVAVLEFDFEVARVLLVDGDEERGAEAAQGWVVRERALEGFARRRALAEGEHGLVCGRRLARRAEEEEAHADCGRLTRLRVRVLAPTPCARLFPVLMEAHSSRSIFFPAWPLPRASPCV